MLSLIDVFETLILSIGGDRNVRAFTPPSLRQKKDVMHFSKKSNNMSEAKINKKSAKNTGQQIKKSVKKIKSVKI